MGFFFMIVFMFVLVIFYNYWIYKENSIGFVVMYLFMFFFVNFGLNVIMFVVFVEIFLVWLWLICYGMFVVVGKVGVIVGVFGFLYVL